MKYSKRRMRGGLLVPVATALGGKLVASALLKTKPGKKAQKWTDKAVQNTGKWFKKTFGKKKKLTARQRLKQNLREYVSKNKLTPLQKQKLAMRVRMMAAHPSNRRMALY